MKITKLNNRNWLFLLDHKSSWDRNIKPISSVFSINLFHVYPSIQKQFCKCSLSYHSFFTIAFGFVFWGVSSFVMQNHHVNLIFQSGGQSLSLDLPAAALGTFADFCQRVRSGRHTKNKFVGCGGGHKKVRQKICPWGAYNL